jgi:hypothetical protein
LDNQLWRLAPFAFVLVVTIGALWKGGRPERLAGAVMLAAALLSALTPDRRWIEVQYFTLGIDATMMVFLVALALTTDRWWPSFAAGFEGLGLLIHLAFAAQPKVMSVVYVTGLNIVGWLVFASLGLGVLAVIGRRRAARIAAGASRP